MRKKGFAKEKSGNNGIEVRKMNSYLKEKSEEIAQKKYLTEKKGKKLFWSDYYDLLALMAGAGLVWGSYRVNLDLEIFLVLAFGYIVGAGILKSRVKKRQKDKIVKMICYEQGLEKFQAELVKLEREKIQKRACEILIKGGMKKDGDKLWWQEEYELKIALKEDELAEVLKEKENVIIIVAGDEKKIRQRMKAKAEGKVILGSIKDLYDLALKNKLVSLPKLNEGIKSEKMVGANSLLLLYGLGLLVLANLSRYFYVYFGGAIILLSVFLVGYMKKGTISEVVLLKKAMNFSKSKV